VKVVKKRKEEKGKTTETGLVVECLLQKKRERRVNEAEGSGPYNIARPSLGKRERGWRLPSIGQIRRIGLVTRRAGRMELAVRDMRAPG
jgi:hypothetical protein